MAFIDDYEMPQGPCVACLYEGELNGNGLCTGCAPRDTEFEKTLMELLGQPYKLTVKEEQRAES